MIDPIKKKLDELEKKRAELERRRMAIEQSLQDNEVRIEQLGSETQAQNKAARLDKLNRTANANWRPNSSH